MLIPESVKKHSITVKPKNESVNESVDVRSAFFCAFSAFPANSPSIPNSNDRIWECFFFFNCSSPVFRIASSGVSLLNFLAGSHAEINTVSTDTRMVAANTSG